MQTIILSHGLHASQAAFTHGLCLAWPHLACRPKQIMQIIAFTEPAWYQPGGGRGGERISPVLSLCPVHTLVNCVFLECPSDGPHLKLPSVSCWDLDLLPDTVG